MDLFLFANFFPYKKAEPFLINESGFARQSASTFSVFTLYGRADEVSQGLNNLILFDPVFESAGNKRSIFLRGFFNVAPFGFHLKELFSKRIFLQPKKLYWFFISALMTRAVLSSDSFKALLQKIKESESPVLYFYWGDNLAWIIPYLKKRVNKNVKVVMRLHGSDLYEHVKSDYAPLRDVIFKNVDAIFTVSENGFNYLKQKYPAHSQKMAVARLGVFDHGAGPAPTDQITIVSVSNLVPLKRVDLIFESLQLLDIKITWHHFGEGPLLNELEQKIKGHRDNLEIKLHGFVSNKHIMDFYKTNAVHLFLNVSTSEGVPVSVMEALSFGIPVLATDVGGTGELVNEKVGKLLSADLTPKKLAEEVAYFLGISLQEQNQLRTNARKQFEEMAFAGKNYSDFYRQILNL